MVGRKDARVVLAGLLLGGCASEVPGTMTAMDASPLDAVMMPMEVEAGALDRPSVMPDAGTGLAADLTVTQVAVFQTVRVPVFASGAPVRGPMRNAPVIVGRPAVVRAYVTPRSGFAPRMVTAELVWDDGTGQVTVTRDTRRIAGASSDAMAESAFAFAVPAAKVTLRARYAVRVLGDAPGASEAQAPRDGVTVALDTMPAPRPVRVVLVPVRWTGDGSNRLPDTSDAQLTRMRAMVTAIYPITELSLTVHEPLSFGQSTLTGNVNFSALNATLMSMRDREAPADDVYYYALVSPRVSRSAYCVRSCVTGQSYLVGDRADPSQRVGGGMGFTGDDSVWTFIHELGHLFGRSHAPCSTTNPDRAFPYAGGRIGEWGWSATSNSFYAPTNTTDFMGYCDRRWVSDYTYRALYQRAVTLGGVASPLVLGEVGARVEVVAVDGEGGAQWLVSRWPRTVVQGERTVRVRYFDGDGEVLGEADAPWVGLSDGEREGEGQVMVARRWAAAASVSIEGGRRVMLPGL